MMDYFDTNIYVYAFCKNIDNKEQKEVSQKLLKESAVNNSLIVSEIILYEFAFVCTKLKENPETIQKNLTFLSRYIVESHKDIALRSLEIFEQTKLYASSFDVFHLCFAQEHKAKLTTFDKGFKKLKDSATTEITIL